MAGTRCNDHTKILIERQHGNNISPVFSSPAQKELWWIKLQELIRVERSHSPAGASINVTYFDNATNFEHVSDSLLGDYSSTSTQFLFDFETMQQRLEVCWI